MGTKELIAKIKDTLAVPVSTEAEVVYLFVEARKWADRQRAAGGGDPYPIMRFYADWVVHTEKDRITPQMRAIMEDVDKSIPLDVQTSTSFVVPKEHNDFIYKLTLRHELIHFSTSNGLLADNFTDNDLWNAFVGLLVQILVDQPINNPTPTISKFRFEPSRPGAALWTVDFKDKRGVVRFGNAY